jgi:uncharacterized cupin superfamily protein
VGHIDWPGMGTTYRATDGQLDGLRPDPIPPSDILEGQPVARSHCLLQADDRRLSTTLWDCTAGRFTWFYGCDEVVHIVDGEVIVQDEQGRSRTLGIGDVALFQAGTTAVWEVPVYVRKVAVSRVHHPRPLPLRILRRLRPRSKGAARRVGRRRASPPPG